MLRAQLTNILSFIPNDDDGEIDIVQTFARNRVNIFYFLNFEINASL